MLSEEGVGIALDDVGELAAALASADVVALRRRVAAARERYTVEAQIGRIAALYREVAAAGGGGSGRRRRRRGSRRPQVRHREPAVRPPRLGELRRPRRVGAERGEPVLDAEVRGQERVVVA